MTDDIRQQAIELYDRFTHEGMERRELLARMVRLTGSVAAANLLIGSIAACAQGKPVVAPDDKRIAARDSLIVTQGRPTYKAYVALPSKPGPPVMVIHENRGLNDHIRDVTRRLAVAGFSAMAPDFLSPVGGTPANEEAAREAIGKLDLGKATADAVMLLQFMRKDSPTGKVGAIGFCWGGAFVNRLAVAAGDTLNAGVAYYGPAPDPSEAPRVQAPLLLHYAGLDERVNATGRPWVAALKAAGKTVEAFTYEGVNHAFNNDTSAERYNRAAADLAWQRTLAFLRRYLR